MHNFEFDPKKNAANRKKHGIDFVAAQALWNDPDLLEIDARSHDEPRTIVIGKIDGTCWSAVTTHRRAKVRIISVRRSRRAEALLYESERVRRKV